MKIKKTLITIAIALIFTLFIGYGIEVFDKAPNREEFCPENLYEIDNEEECLKLGGYFGSNVMDSPRAISPEFEKEFCQPSKECYDNYNLARTGHDKVVFIISTIIGLIAIIIGIILKTEVVNTGLIGGGIVLTLYGTIRYWEHASNILKFILLGLVLAVLIWISYKKLNKN
jgi:hypothetical protein